MPLSDVQPFGELRTPEDWPALNLKGEIILTVAKNCLPDTEISYIQAAGLSVVSSGGSLDAFARGAYAGVDTVGNAFNFAGDATKLYRLIGTTFTDKSKSGGYNNATDSMWEFTQFRDTSVGELIIATNLDDPVQAIAPGGASFSDLGTNVPKARHIASLQRFVVLGNVIDSGDGVVPNRVHWSPIDNPAGDWTPAAATQAGNEDLRTDAGWVQAIAAFQEYAIVFQERAIWRMTFVGGGPI